VEVGVRLQFAIVSFHFCNRTGGQPSQTLAKNGPPPAIPALRMTANEILQRSTASGR